MPDYLNMIAALGIAGAHPGGLQLTKQFLPAMDLPFPCRILDAGCGTGQTLSYLSALGYSPSGIDSDQRMVRKARERLGESAAVQQGKLEQMPYPGSHFDAVFSESVLSFTDTSAALKECRRVLVPGGKLGAVEVILEQPLHSASRNEIMDFYGFKALLSEKEWQNLFGSCGYCEVRSLKAEEFSFTYDDEQPDHELMMDESVPPEVFDVYQAHQLILQKYSGYLSYRAFIAARC
ncbi:class I SAM-dependent methyltransferase [Metabacillus sp. 113a]|uniref:class I SAM-dependent methyltransferase n=1 Tax=Metabacillus sp. 113a TaxID=3404706 RepID=UPI003CE94845